MYKVQKEGGFFNYLSIILFMEPVSANKMKVYSSPLESVGLKLNIKVWKLYPTADVKFKIIDYLL